MATPQTERSNERSYHNSTYALPNDNTEHQRLETQAEFIRELMNDHLIHSPLTSQNIHKALDIGCGTGAMTHHIASEFPNACVYGLDFSPVPNVREKLSNIEYITANFNDVTDVDKPDACFQPGSFDYVFSRLLVLGMTDWPGYVSRSVELVKPGGWLEMHDIEFNSYRVPEDPTPAQREMTRPHSLTLAEALNESHPLEAWRNPCEWEETFKELCAHKGMDLESAKKLPKWFVENGLEDVQIKRYAYYTGAWEGMTDAERRFALFHKNTSMVDLVAGVRKVGQGQDVVSQDKVERAVAEMNELVNDKWESSRSFDFVYAVCGRKPAT